VSFEGVSFSYDGAEPALKSVSFSIAERERVVAPRGLASVAG